MMERNEDYQSSLFKGGSTVILVGIGVFFFSSLPLLISAISKWVINLNLGTYEFDDINKITETLIATATATWVGAYFAFKWQSRKESRANVDNIRKDIHWVRYQSNKHLIYLSIVYSYFNRVPLDNGMFSFPVCTRKTFIPKIEQWNEVAFRELVLDVELKLREAVSYQNDIFIFSNHFEQFNQLVAGLSQLEYESLNDICENECFTGNISDLSAVVGHDNAERICKMALTINKEAISITEGYSEAMDNLHLESERSLRNMR